MSFPTPTLSELARRAEAELPLSTGGEALRRNLFTPIARAVAAAVSGLYGQQAWIARQLDPATCDEDILLDVYVPLYLASGRKAAAAASGLVTLTGTAGASVAAGTVWQRSDGVTFTNANDETIGGAGTLTVTLVCETAGNEGNTETGATLSLVTSVAGVDSDATVLTPGITGGSDIEAIADLRARVVAKRAAGGEVGRAVDWENWALECAGVTRAWAAPQLAGVGTMTVFFVRDDDATIYPDANEVATVQSYLQLTGTPFGEVYALAPTVKAVDFSIRCDPNTSAVRAAVQTALTNLFADAAAPVARDADGNTVTPVEGVTIPLYLINAAINNAAGLTGHTLAAPSADVVCAAGEMAELGTITWLS